MPGFNPGLQAYAAYDPSSLLASDHDTYTRKVTLLSGQNQPKGAVLGKITTGGKYKLSASASSDGSQLLANAAVLMEACDATSGDKTCVVYLSGGFNASKLTFGTGYDKDSAAEGLAKGGIYVYDDYAIDA